ncbi:MAG: hypothetical protein E6G85_23160 [Alphaproteobacteria bacterium]|nr:MAG: hypothetical protein E6G85_23160 [Alphaproteobacteria bacterium]
MDQLAVSGIRTTFPLAAFERIKRPPPIETELARIAVDEAMNDGSLQIIIATGKGYVRFRGVKADGSYDFESVGNPWSQEKLPRQTPRCR